MKPDHTTHVAETVEIPPVQAELLSERPPLPVPSLWQEGVVAIRKTDGREAAVVRIDHGTMMFRPFWLDTREVASQTTWESCRDYNVRVRKSQAEVEREEFTAKLREALAELDARELGIVEALAVAGVNDPKLSLAKIDAMRAAGMIGKAKK